jgi:hypothetical protein
LAKILNKIAKHDSVYQEQCLLKLLLPEEMQKKKARGAQVSKFNKIPEVNDDELPAINDDVLKISLQKFHEKMQISKPNYYQLQTLQLVIKHIQEKFSSLDHFSYLQECIFKPKNSCYVVGPADCVVLLPDGFLSDKHLLIIEYDPQPKEEHRIKSREDRYYNLVNKDFKMVSQIKNEDQVDDFHCCSNIHIISGSNAEEIILKINELFASLYCQKDVSDVKTKEDHCSLACVFKDDYPQSPSLPLPDVAKIPFPCFVPLAYKSNTAQCSVR